jgi:hypothetical protein
MGGETRRAKSFRNGVHHANGVVWGPVYRTHLDVRVLRPERRLRERVLDPHPRRGALGGLAAERDDELRGFAERGDREDVDAPVEERRRLHDRDVARDDVALDALLAIPGFDLV